MECRATVCGYLDACNTALQCVDEVGPLRRAVGLTPRFPHHPRNVRHDVLNSAPVHLELRAESPLFCFGFAAFSGHRSDEQRHHAGDDREDDRRSLQSHRLA